MVVLKVAGSGHGTYSRYSGGCRCDACKLAASDYAKEYRARRLAAGNYEHGKVGYSIGCRCEECTESHRLRLHRQREERREKYGPVIAFAASMLGGRCGQCGCADIENLVFINKEDDSKGQTVRGLIYHNKFDEALALIPKTTLVCKNCWSTQTP